MISLGTNKTIVCLHFHDPRTLFVSPTDVLFVFFLCAVVLFFSRCSIWTTLFTFDAHKIWINTRSIFNAIRTTGEPLLWSRERTRKKKVLRTSIVDRIDDRERGHGCEPSASDSGSLGTIYLSSWLL